MSGRWWTAVGGPPTLDEVEKQLLTPTGPVETDLSQAFLAWHRIGSRMIGTVARAPLPDVRAIDTAVLAVSEDAFDGLLTSVSKSLTLTYASLLVRDTIAESATGARDTFRYLVDHSVSPPVAMERTALVFGVPFRSLGSYLATAKTPGVSPRVVDHEADMAVMEAAKAFADAEAVSPVAKDAAFEAQVSRDEDGRFATEEGLTAAKPQVRRGRFARRKRRVNTSRDLTPPPAQEAAAPPAQQKRSSYSLLRQDVLGLGGLAQRTAARQEAERAKVAEVRAARAAKAKTSNAHAESLASQTAVNEQLRNTDRQVAYQPGSMQTLDDTYSADLTGEQRQALIEAMTTGGTISLRDMGLSGSNAERRKHLRSGFSLNEGASFARASAPDQVRSQIALVRQDVDLYAENRPHHDDFYVSSATMPVNVAWSNLEQDDAMSKLHIVEQAPRTGDRHAQVRVTSMPLDELTDVSGWRPSLDNVDEVIALWTPGTLIGDLVETRHGDDSTINPDVAYSANKGDVSFVLDATTGKSTMFVYLDPASQVRKSLRLAVGKDYAFQEADVRRDEYGRFATESGTASPRRSRRSRMHRRVNRSSWPQPAPAPKPQPSATYSLTKSYTLAGNKAGFYQIGISNKQRTEVHREQQAARRQARGNQRSPKFKLTTDSQGYVDHEQELANGLDRDYAVVRGMDRAGVDALVRPVDRSGMKFRLSKLGVAMVDGKVNPATFPGEVSYTRRVDPRNTVPGPARIVLAAHPDTKDPRVRSGMGDVELEARQKIQEEDDLSLWDLEGPSDETVRASMRAQEDRDAEHLVATKLIADAEAAGKPFRILLVNGQQTVEPIEDTMFAFEDLPKGVDPAKAVFEWQPFTQSQLAGKASADLMGLASTYQPAYWVASYVGQIQD